MDKASFLELYHDPTLRIPQIAERLGVSRTTVSRYIKRYGLPKRYARPWPQPEILSPSLAYLVGAWITDGNINTATGQLCIFNADRRFLGEIAKCAKGSGLPSVRIWERSLSRKSGSLGTARQFICTIYSILLTRWLATAFGPRKEHIAPIVFESSLESKVRFISAVIDGDGHVGKDGSIRVRKTHDWLLHLPALCASAGIRCSEASIARVLPSGKPYRNVGINRQEFLAAGGHCMIASKRERMLHPHSRRYDLIAQNAWPCPMCGKPRKSPRAKLCCACFHASRRKPDGHS